MRKFIVKIKCRQKYTDILCEDNNIKELCNYEVVCCCELFYYLHIHCMQRIRQLN